MPEMKGSLQSGEAGAFLLRVREAFGSKKREKQLFMNALLDFQAGRCMHTMIYLPCEGAHREEMTHAIS